MTVNKQNITHGIVILWIIFSVGYIAQDLWSDLQTYQVQQAYTAGKEEIIIGIMENADKCEPISLYKGKEQIQIIPTACVQEQVVQ